MIAYVDSSVLLRKLFREPDSLAEWKAIEGAYTSRLLLVEAGRVIDRARLGNAIDDAAVADLRQELASVLDSITVLAVTERVWDRAQGPMPTTLGTLDALHLATALELSHRLDAPLVLATHDRQLATAARASGLKVVGVAPG